MDLCPGSDSSCWPDRQTHRTGALQPGKELGAEFHKVGQTVLVRSKAWPDKRVTSLHTSSLFYPLVPLLPCNTSQNTLPLHIILCSMPHAASPLSPKRDPAVIHLDGSPGTALGGLRQAVLPSESLIWAPICLQDPVLPWWKWASDVLMASPGGPGSSWAGCDLGSLTCHHLSDHFSWDCR